MTMTPDPTVQTPIPAAEPYPGPPMETRESPASTASATAGHGHREVRPEDPKRNPITYLALAIAMLALILSVAALTRDNGPHQIDVGGKRCIVDRIDGNDADTLFCQS
jgi:hypothetical protein